MQDEVGDERLLERGRKALDQLVGQPPDEADRVGDEVAPAVVLEPARRRVERLEEAVVDGDVGAGQGVQERGLADVRVAGERDRRRLRAPARLPPGLALLLQLLAGGPSAARPGAGRGGGRSRAATRRGRGCRRRRRGARGAATAPASAAGCTRAARARPGACPRRCARAGRRCRGSAGCGRRPAPGGGSRAGAAAAGRARRRRAATLLRTRRRRLLQLLELPLADVRARIGPGADLDELSDGLDACRPRELTDLRELLARIGAPRQHGDDEPTLRIRPGGGIGLAMGHGVIMTAGLVRNEGPPPRSGPSDARSSVQVDAQRDEAARRDACEEALARLAGADEHRDQLLLGADREAGSRWKRSSAQPSAPVGTSGGIENWLNGVAVA